MSVSVLFVCLGNICRSPTAHGVFQKYVAESEFAKLVEVDSAGTGSWHLGEAPDRRATQAARGRGYDLSHLRARQVDPADFEHFNYILAMDEENLAELEAMAPADYPGHLSLFLDFAVAATEREVPDPYYGGADGFDHVLDLVESASAGLLEAIRREHRL